MIEIDLGIHRRVGLPGTIPYREFMERQYVRASLA